MQVRDPEDRQAVFVADVCQHGGPAPSDIYPDLQGPPSPADGLVLVEGRSLLCYVARDEV